MKQIINTPFRYTYTLLAGILVFFSGCSKSDGPDKVYNVIDKDYFFTISFQGKSYSSYGWYQSDFPDRGNGAPFMTVEYSVDPTTGDTTWTRHITVIDHVTNNNIYPKEVGTCNAYFKITRKGSAMGVYTVVTGPRADNKFYDLDGKSYLIEQGGEQFNLTRRSDPNSGKYYIEGIFQCNLLEVNGDYTKPIPATGSFRLKGY